MMKDKEVRTFDDRAQIIFDLYDSIQQNPTINISETSHQTIIKIFTG